MTPRFKSPKHLAAPAPCPTGATGDWRLFGLGVLLIGVLLGALALIPHGIERAAHASPSATVGARALPVAQGLAVEREASTAGAVEDL